MSSTESRFLKISIALFLIALMVAYALNANSKDLLVDKEKIEEINGRIGVIAEGDRAGQKVDMSESLLIADEVVGEGEEVKAGDQVSVHYTGQLSDGTVFDSSVNRGRPFEFTVGIGQVIQGWDQGLMGMKVGGKRQLTIPPELAYGDQVVGTIPANSTLLFEVELLDILH